MNLTRQKILYSSFFLEDDLALLGLFVTLLVYCLLTESSLFTIQLFSIHLLISHFTFLITRHFSFIIIYLIMNFHANFSIKQSYLQLFSYLTKFSKIFVLNVIFISSFSLVIFSMKMNFKTVILIQNRFIHLGNLKSFNHLFF